jgi:phosphoenolpyruvate synthase/pyruvate phosphate dikinase
MLYTKTLRNIEEADLRIVGKRAFRIAKLAQNFSSMHGFVITSLMLEKFLAVSRISQKAFPAAGFRFWQNATAAGRAIATDASGIKESILAAQMPDELEEEILENYHSLNISGGKLKELLQSYQEPLVMLRPSYLENSGQTAQKPQKDIINLKGEKKIIDAIKGIWAENPQGVAIIVQKMPSPAQSGRLYTTCPTNDGEVLIEACFGFGENISG